MAIVALRSEFSGDPERVIRVGTEVEWFGTRVLMPSAILVFLSGVALTHRTASFQELWVIVSLAAFALSAVLALIYLGPNPGVLKRLIEQHGKESEAVRSRIRRHFVFNRIEVALLIVVFVDMILKPGR